MMTHHRSLLLAVVVVVVCSGHLGGVHAQLGLHLNGDGSYDVRVRGNTWLTSADTAFYVNDEWLSIHNFRLALTKNTTTRGANSYGSFTEYTNTWKAASQVHFGFEVETAFKVYENGNRIMFTQRWVSGGKNTSAGTTDNVLSSFPSFNLSHTPPSSLHLGCAGWFGTFIDDSHRGPAIGKWPDGTVGGKDFGPMVLFDRDTDDAVVFAAASEFMAASVEKTDNALRAGILGSVEEVPAGFSVAFSLTLNTTGVNNAMTSWGRALRRHYNKSSAPAQCDLTLQYLGYNTDHGAYYYYNPQSPNFNETLVGVFESAKQQSIPYRWILLDSWWYFKGTGNGVKNWTAMPQIFPPGGTDGLAEFTSITQWPVIGHNRYWSNNTDYAIQNGGKFAFSDNKYAMVVPLEQAFWDFLLGSSKKWGLAVYEQDWLYNEFNGVPLLTKNISMARTWLMQMGNAAAKHNLTIQYCMPYPRHALQSVEISPVTQIRASDDYVPGAAGPDQWRLGSSSILAHALGLAPFKDNFWTTPRQPNASTGPLGHDDAVWREAAVATLSAGPVTPADGIPYQNKELIMRSCNEDGLLLNPDRPAVSIDQTFKAAAFGAAFGAAGQLWATYSTIGSHRFNHVFAAEMKNTFDLLPSTLTVDATATATATEGMVAYAVANTTSLDVSTLRVQQFSREVPIVISAQTSTPNTFDLYHTAPVFDNGIAFLGELSKWVPTSSKRFKGFTKTASSIKVEVVGALGEKVTAHFAYMSSSTNDITIKHASCVISGGTSCHIESP
ncbi:hypothetical protein PTSG_04123 [Salpingoeca rosetta]|uniref:Uncharacterized protein n=1 Tax=Salpingoeca rosetta (strain ATCC 50818 / BSB-021) TaxID=946362 RepID=F2U6N2_SALR5|nr:uncharacterized protein PTSG_04123 [Salpingoeca rosetta]EGD83514.1 hypothetical protein PTSG_04123 [Salpingoeca rosetta]|eukprot:XP_004995018.1 hypothetical protein PTSG_04123 [Salpingoeca rosetta]